MTQITRHTPGSCGIAGSPTADINGDGTLNTNTGFDDWEFLANHPSAPLRFHENVANYADGATQVTSAGSEMTDEEAMARGFMLVVVEPTAALLPGCSDKSSSSGRQIPLVVYGTTAFDATAIGSAWSTLWNGAAPSVGFIDDVDSDGEDDWIGHFPADEVVLGAGTSAFTAQLATSQVILAQPAVSFAAVADTDGDGICDASDLCFGDDLADLDSDTVPDACDLCPLGDDALDTDLDGVPNSCDACPLDANDDSDGDGICDGLDVCPGDDALDIDLDGVPDACDLCPLDVNDDTDGDGVCDADDRCFGDDAIDADSDATPDACDPCPLDPLDDTDLDGVCDSADICPNAKRWRGRRRRRCARRLRRLRARRRRGRQRRRRCRRRL